MPRSRSKRPVHLEGTRLAPLPPAMEEWERALIEPVLARLFDVRKATAAEPKELRDGEADPEGGCIAVVPAFPGCYSQGETVDEALSNAREAILLTIEDMRERGDAIPDPAGELVRRVAVGA